MKLAHLTHLLLFICVPSSYADELKNTTAARNSDDLEFFEAKIRPVLVEHCYQCHSASSKTVQGGLRLDSAATVRSGGDTGPAVVPGNVDESLLLAAINYDSFEMPPNKKLPPKVIADFKKWILRGAVDPRTGDPPAAPSQFDIESRRDFWAFQQPQSAKLDNVTDYSERIDRLVQRQLDVKQIAPNPPAEKRTLLRRMYFDLTGLPPTESQLRDFLNDDSADAMTRQVDLLLASPRYGERWTRLWLDIARYAEDQAHIVGNNKALFYPNAYLYRDWVINAFNNDMPYDRFINLQLAADALEMDSDKNIAALGFIGLGPKYYRRGDPEVMADEWEDRVDVVTRGLQGLTVACARCHNHKFDPIATEDYYALAGIFAGTEMFNRPFNKDDEKEKNGQAKNPDKSLHVVRDTKPTDLAVMIRGDVNNKGDVVHRGFVQVLYPGPRRTFDSGSGRAELAHNITDPSNPLTARVFVNRIWQQYFGTGIVKTTSNFGQLGERPSNQPLLDDLATGFVNNGWSIKWLHRQIVLSKTYQCSSTKTAQASANDPANALLWRIPRRRLSVEGWRDAVLAVSGVLSDQIGGQSIKPDNPKETRRTIYSEVSRFELNPLLSLFDFPDPNTHSARRQETNTPLQKLFLMNSDFMTTMAGNVVSQLSSADTPQSPEQKVTSLFKKVLLRRPDPQEIAAAIIFVNAHPEDGMLQFTQVLMASNEFWFVD